MLNREWIRLQRLKLRKTQAEIGREIGWSQRAICELETGKRGIAADRLPALAKSLNCNITDFFTDTLEDDKETA